MPADILSQIDIHTLKGLTQDSREVRPGWLFAALPGSRADGAAYIADAVRAGASAVLAGPGTILPRGCENARLLVDENPRRALALIAAAFHARQPACVAAVTGTNGKTSTALFTRQIWESAGHRAASMGTLGIQARGLEKPGAMTTPGPVALHAELAGLADAGVTHLAMEASSHGLDQHRLDGVKLRAAGFTNLSRDHLDYHPDMESYFLAKARLFAGLLPEGGTAVLNADIPEFSRLHDICMERKIKVISYGFSATDLKILSLEPSGGGQNLELEIMGTRHGVSLPLVGGFQAMNALCALGLALAGDCVENDTVRIGEYVRALSTLQGAPGRLQAVPGTPPGIGVYVDYAHTPDALETVLKALRPHVKEAGAGGTGRLVCVFGCGGDRDRGKRPVMGEIAALLADTLIVTDDNPRSENPADIRAQVMAGAGEQATEIEGRHAAIAAAVGGLEPGDVLVIAGKGHERGQIFSDRTEPFDDVAEAAAAIRAAFGREYEDNKARDCKKR